MTRHQLVYEIAKAIDEMKGVQAVSSVIHSNNSSHWINIRTRNGVYKVAVITYSHYDDGLTT